MDYQNYYVPESSTSSASVYLEAIAALEEYPFNSATDTHTAPSVVHQEEQAPWTGKWYPCVPKPLVLRPQPYAIVKPPARELAWPVEHMGHGAFKVPCDTMNKSHPPLNIRPFTCLQNVNKRKRPRGGVTTPIDGPDRLGEYQRLYLEKEFASGQYLAYGRRSDLAKLLGLPLELVRKWFIARARRARNQLKKEQQRKAVVENANLENISIYGEESITLLELK